MKYIFLFALISCILCTPRSDVSDIYKNLKTRINKCILQSEEVSTQLKELAKKNLNSGESNLINIHSIELTDADRLVVKECKKQAFRKKVKSGSSVVTPIGIDQAVHSKKFVEKQPRGLRKLSMMSQIIRLGGFNIAGIFDCIENGQPAIKIIRDSIYFLKSMDYTTAIINIYDNVSVISSAVSYCFSAIFPSN